MSPQEYDIYHFLNRTPDRFVPIYEIVQSMGGSRTFANGRYWALESLQRMTEEGLVEKSTNDTEEFRIRRNPDGTAEVVRTQHQARLTGESPTEFLKALQYPGSTPASLGDTTIISIRDLEKGA